MTGASSCLGEWLELCRETELGELSDQTLGFGFGCGAVEVVGAKVAMRCAGLHHVVDGGEERSSHSADRLLRPAPGAQAMELRAVVAVLGAFGGPGTLHEHGLEPRGAFAQARRFAFAGTLVVAGAQPGPGDEVSSRRKAAHVRADLAQDGGRRPKADAGDCAQASDQFAKGRLPVGCLFVHAFDLVSDLLI